MLFTPVIRRSAYVPAARTLDRFFDIAVPSAVATQNCQVEQDAQAYTLSFDVPGVSREQLSIGIEGNVVRLETLADAPRQYKAAYELPQDIDAVSSEARLENGVLTLKLAKVQPESRITRLTIN